VAKLDEHARTESERSDDMPRSSGTTEPMRQSRFVEASGGSCWVAAVMTPYPITATIRVVPTLKQEGRHREQKTQVWCDRSNSDSARHGTRRCPRRGRRNRQHFNCSKRHRNAPGSFCTRATAVRDRYESICSVRYRSRSVRVGSTWIRIGFMTGPEPLLVPQSQRAARLDPRPMTVGRLQ
jgi:hypothetical protein